MLPLGVASGIVMNFEKSFSATLEKVFGARGIVFIARDGEIVHQCVNRGVANLDLLGAYHGITLATCQRFFEETEVGTVQTVICQYEAGTCLIQVLRDGYFLMLALEKEGNIGHGIHLLRALAPEVNEEIA
ncbi:MAG: hypothetical protein K1Y36_19520 [Blastocatellia bacterium]|nr:hypothetical protein [Blastocatellia bacterium]